MSADDSRDFASHCQRPGVRLHVRPTRRFKSVWIDAHLSQPLQPVSHTRLCLGARLLERGTRRHPGLLELNRHTDDLYGANLSVATEAFGAFQVLRLHYDAVDAAFLPRPAPDLLTAGFRLLGEVLHEPYLEEGVFPAPRVRQEKEALARFVEGANADRSLWAQRRCLQHMCAGEPYALAAYGDPADLAALDDAALWRDLQGFVDSAPLDIYVCGDVDPEAAADLCAEHLDRGQPRRNSGRPLAHTGSGGPRRILETGDVAQGRLFVGLRAGIGLAQWGTENYAAFQLFNLLFGGDAHSRLYTRVREEAGLCYHIASYTEPMAGLLMVEAGVEAADQQAVVDHIRQQLQQLQDQGPAIDELERSRALARQRLEGFEDGRDGLVRFHGYRRLAGADVSRRRQLEALAGVTPEAVAAAARRLDVDTIYYLATGTPAGVDR